MFAYIVKRLLYLVFVLWGVGVTTFLISHALPADPAAAALGPNAREAQIQEFRQRKGLDQPLAVQYARYTSDLLRGDLGQSLRTNRDIGADLRDFFPATLELTLLAIVFAVVFGLPLGVVAALTQNRWPDLLVRTLALLGGAVPVYWLAILLLNLLHGQLGWLPGPGRLDAYLLAPKPVTGFLLIDSLIAGDYEVLRDGLIHLILPALVLGAFSAALLTRMSRSAMLEVLGQDYVRTARAKGLARPRVVLKHAMRNAALPILTVAGSLLGSLLTGAVLTETIFSWPGIGRYATDSALSLDFPAVMGVTLVAGLTYSVINLLVDLLYAVFDPRIQYR